MTHKQFDEIEALLSVKGSENVRRELTKRRLIRSGDYLIDIKREKAARLIEMLKASPTDTQANDSPR